MSAGNATPMTANLLLIGPPKCGTSSLYDWLSGHPQIAASRPKEPFYLMDPGHPLRRPQAWDQAGDEGYARFFDPGQAARRYRMDATTHTIFQKSALDYVRQHPDCRVVCVLRDPTARLRSSFEFTRNNRSVIDSACDFDTYVRAVRSGAPLYPKLCLRPENAYVLERDLAYGEYLRHLRPWREAVGETRLFVATFEQMVADPAAFVGGLCRFLGIDPGYFRDARFARKNETVTVRSPGLHRRVRRLGAAVADGPLKRLAKRLYLGLQTRPRPPPAQGGAPAALAELRRHYQPHNEALAREFGLDLSAWGR